jgi:hypothetical protein
MTIVRTHTNCMPMEPLLVKHLTKRNSPYTSRPREYHGSTEYLSQTVNVSNWLPKQPNLLYTPAWSHGKTLAWSSQFCYDWLPHGWRFGVTNNTGPENIITTNKISSDKAPQSVTNIKIATRTTILFHLFLDGAWAPDLSRLHPHRVISWPSKRGMSSIIHRWVIIHKLLRKIKNSLQWISKTYQMWFSTKREKKNNYVTKATYFKYTAEGA